MVSQLVHQVDAFQLMDVRCHVNIFSDLKLKVNMSEIGLDELTKQKYEAQMLLEALQYQQSLNALKKKSNELNDLTGRW